MIGMKRFLLFALAVSVSLSAAADEGMWLPSLIGTRIKDMRSKGFRLSAEDIYSINKASLKDAIVLFGGGCTGELVSDQGLLLTNHHCGYGAIQKLSSLEHDYLTDGFWAMNRAEELPAEGLEVKFLVRMEDVTDKVGEDKEKQKRLVEQACEGGRYQARIESLYYGNQQFLFVYEVFKDVRLVGTPPSSIGKFGGDTDNWIWPRHTGDFSVFRIYADKNNAPAEYSPENVPYRPKKHFDISTKGVEEGDFTFVYGFPGTTQEYVISDAADYILNRSNPAKIKLRTIRLDIIDKAQQSDPLIRIQYASKHAGIANAWKKWQGESKGLARLGTVENKRRYEAEFQKWAADKPQYAHLLDSLHAQYDKWADAYFLREYYTESVYAIELNRPARTVYAAAKKGALSESQTKDMAEFYKNYNQGIDRLTAVRMIEEFIADIPAGYGHAYLNEQIAAHGGVQGYVDYLFDNSVLTSRESFERAASSAEALEQTAKSDPMIALYASFLNTPFTSASVAYRNLSAVPSIAALYRPYMRALMEFDSKRPFYPDANLTLRVAYGHVGGYDYSDAVYHRHYTTLDGIIEKDNPQIYDYDIPQSLRDIYAAKDYGRWGVVLDGRYTVPVAFIATNHTTGGNSGSPILNARGELLGLNFDRTWLSTMSDIEFDASVCRNISVDIRFVLFAIDKIGGAGYLIDEMTLK